MKPQSFVTRYQIIVAITLLTALVGCAPSLAPISLPTAVPTSTLLPDLTPSSTVPADTSTPSLASPTIVPSPTDTVLPSPKPASTLTADERQAFVMEMLKTNGDCELPCWWGIVPGQTDWQVLKNRFIAYGGSVFDVPHSTPPLDYRITHSFVQQDGTVGSILVMGEASGGTSSDRFAKDWQRYSLDQVLTRYGVPSQVWVFALPATEPGAVPRYGVTVAYVHLGVTMYYEGVADTSDSKLSACPDLRRTFLILMQLQPPIARATLAQPIFPDGKPYVKSLEEATGMSLDTFYKTFKNADSQACLDLPTTWP